MAHVAFCIAPFAGHVHPSLAVVRELASRGHRVSYATTAEFSATARAAGGHVVGYQTTMRIAAEGRQPWKEPSRDSMVQAQRVLLRELEAVAPVLNRAFDDDVPDVVVCDPMTWAGRALAGRCQVPAVLSMVIMIGDSHWSLGSAASVFDPAHPALPVVFAATSAVLSRLRTGLSADRLYLPDDGVPMIAYWPRAFQVRGDEFGPNVSFVGPCLPSRPGEARPGMAPAAPADGRDTWSPGGSGPLVIVSLGTVVNHQPDLFHRCADALASLDCQVLLALGGLDPGELGALPANARVLAHLPFAAALRHADVFVGQGGMTSTMEALSFGVPIVALPQTPEQRTNASRLAELGLGIRLELGQQTQEALRGAVSALLGDAEARVRLDWMRQEIERAPGAPAAAEVIEKAMRGRHGGESAA